MSDANPPHHRGHARPGQSGQQWSASIHRVAAEHGVQAEHGVPIADYLASSSGADGDVPTPKEWTPDGAHPTVEASAELAKVAALGYSAVAPGEP